MLLLETYDTLAHELEATMDFPANSVYTDGKNHGIYIPIIRKSGKKWFVSLWLENAVYVYRQENSILQDTTLTVPIEGMVNYESIPISESENFFDVNADIRAGHISNVLFTKVHIVVVYRKGLTAFQTQNMDESGNEKDLKKEQMDPFFAAVYDHSLNLLDPEVPFPKGICGQ